MTNDDIGADLREHEQRIFEQIGFARAALTIDGEEPANEAILSLLRYLADSGFRLEPDLEGLSAAARDHMEASKSDFMQALLDSLPPEVQTVLDAVKAAGMQVTIIPIAAGECTNPDCPVHGGKSDEDQG